LISGFCVNLTELNVPAMIFLPDTS
jgi:hypothetical protein